MEVRCIVARCWQALMVDMSCDGREILSLKPRHISMRTTDSKNVVIISFGTRKPLQIILVCPE